MSGPKSSRYTLTAEQLKRILEEQERLRRELEEKAKKERECKEARAYLATTKAKVAMHLEMIQANEKRLSAGGDGSTGLHDRYRTIYSLIKRLDTICTVKANASHSTLMSSKKEAEHLLNEIVSMEGEISTETDNALMLQKIQEDSLIADGMKISFNNVGINETPEEPIFSEVVCKLEKLLSLELSHELLSEVNDAIEQAKRIESVSVMQNFSSITAEPLCKRCYTFADFAEKNKELYDTLLDKYEALCTQLCVQAKQIEFSEEGMEELKIMIVDLTCQANQDAEQTYICQSVDSVMEEMGYEVIGHRQVRKKSGKEFRSKLLTYEDGTVINITESSSGQITMEIGSADDQDRLPTANERVALRKNMESFCKDFKEIEQRLSARGVVLKSRLSMAPPEEAYAQIINFTDYELVEDYQAVATKKRASQSNSQKRMRDEGSDG